eukprot:231713_1
MAIMYASKKQLKNALKAFKMFNKRSPTKAEIDHVKAFLANDKLATKSLFVTPINRTRSSMRYEIYLDGSKDQNISPQKQTQMKQFIESHTCGLNMFSKSMIAEQNVDAVVQKR